MTNDNNAKPAGFAQLGISGTLLDAAIAAGMSVPKPIQEKAIPAFLEGRDILGVAQTGSGKTAAFSLPILSKIIGLGNKRRPRTARALVLVPTRELAVQIEKVVRELAKGAHVSTALVLGGVSRRSQVKRMAPGVDVLIATPGRLTDLVREGEIVLSDTTWLVLDEADRMLDMGFINDVRRIAKATHPARQTALFSATMPSEIEKLSASLLREPVRVEIARQGTTAAEIRQSVVMARTKQKRKVLSDMLADDKMRQVIIFARTKHGADRVTRDLSRDGFEAAVIHGNKSQNARQRALDGFRSGSVRILVATDIAARGIDVPGISHVVNFDLPDEAESYVHRIGRTGRNGATGEAITLCDPTEASKLRQVERIIRMRLDVTQDVTREPDPVHRDPAPARQEPANDRPRAFKPKGNAGGERPGSKPPRRKRNRRGGPKNGAVRFGSKAA
ncbi:DEAD/DEAH box helicase [Chelativorans xinjiangense]|uniref:DEAD/DEAH box helicase n=1 Tax=Chelativorans xinjiangense TaxID=2681485 RepID=UPI001FE38F7E|nr:DEAD/DEAH box helicase [Chelativorans xinjiangense]